MKHLFALIFTLTGSSIGLRPVASIVRGLAFVSLTFHGVAFHRAVCRAQTQPPYQSSSPPAHHANPWAASGEPICAAAADFLANQQQPRTDRAYSDPVYQPNGAAQTPTAQSWKMPLGPQQWRSGLGTPNGTFHQTSPDNPRAKTTPLPTIRWSSTKDARSQLRQAYRMAFRPTATAAANGDADDLLADDLLADDLLGDDLLGGDDLLEGDGLLSGDGLFNEDDNADPLDALAAEPDPIDAPSDRDPSNTEKDPHEDLWTEDCYPSAETCRKCHPSQYEQWRSSGHAYAAVSPMFNRFEQAMTELTEGTVGSFCVRCHSPVGTQLKLPRALSVLDAPPVVREGVTCIACHRVNEHYWRSNGDRRIEPGNIHAPVNGGHGGAGVRAAIADKEDLKLKTSPEEKGPGQSIHRQGRFFEPLTKSDICVSCHQVAVHPGIWLEVVHAQYRSGPASKRGVSCQDCHMGAVPGKPLGYDIGHAAYLNDKPFGEKRKQSNHMFWGPGYSIAHPGIFPHHPKAKQYSPRQWLDFDYRAGWGTEAFENAVSKNQSFPEPWDTTDDRRDARKIIDENLHRLKIKRAAAIQTMEGGTKVCGPYFETPPLAGQDFHFSYRVENISEGHNLPTGSLGAQPQLWLNVALIDPDGIRVWESGYLDSNGDLCDMHSVDVATHRIRRDKNLFNLQTKFLINNVRGTDREAALPLNFSLDQLVFLRPGAVPVSVLNHPPLIRMEAHSIPPLDHRIANYHIPSSVMQKRGPYRLSVRLRSRTEPMYFMRQINSTPEMIRRMIEGTLDLHPSSHTFWVK